MGAWVHIGAAGKGAKTDVKTDVKTDAKTGDAKTDVKIDVKTDGSPDFTYLHPIKAESVRTLLKQFA